MKSRIIQGLGQTDILLPSLVVEGLAANDRIKVRMSALQAAAIVRAVEAGAPSEGRTAASRLAAIKAEELLEPANEIAPARIAKLTGIPEDGGDSVHRLVMDLHKALNRLAAGCAEEGLAGAHVFGLRGEDRPVVEAFMRGVERTRTLKFDHPGLDTTATRSGSRLVIQNDIGATDAHVVVIAIEDCTVRITYTDVHLARSKFFAGLFDEFPVVWSGLDRQWAEGLGDEGVFYLVTGRYEAKNTDDREHFLEARLAACGDPVILVRPDTSTTDVAGFAAAAGILTAVGGRTAHAALVARRIVGCGDLAVDMASRQARVGASAIKEGEWISVDREGGSVHLDRLEVIVEPPEAELAEVERWRAGANPREAVS
jgi:phosphohistidine swiveling domain-containing protein